MSNAYESLKIYCQVIETFVDSNDFGGTNEELSTIRAKIVATKKFLEVSPSAEANEYQAKQTELELLFQGIPKYNQKKNDEELVTMLITNVTSVIVNSVMKQGAEVFVGAVTGFFFGAAASKCACACMKK